MKYFKNFREEKESGEEHHASVIPLTGFSPISHMGHSKDLGGSLKKLPGKKHIGISSKSDLYSDKERKDVLHKQWGQHDLHTHIVKSGGETIANAYHSLPKHGKKHLHILVGHDRKDFAHGLKSSLESGKIKEMGHHKWDSITIHHPTDSDRTHGMSGTNMRNAAEKGDVKEFHKHLGSMFSHDEAKHHMEKFKKGLASGQIKVKRPGAKKVVKENVGKYKALFVFGGPGSGKDIVIRDMVYHQGITEMNTSLASSIIHKINERVNDARCDVIKNRMPLLINGTTNEAELVIEIKEELEKRNYETMMIFVDTTDEVSRIRNEKHVKSIAESVRHEKWKQTQIASTKLSEHFNKYLQFDNSVNLNEATDSEIIQKEEDIEIITEMITWFLSTPAKVLQKVDVNRLFESATSCSCKHTKKTLTDNICPSCQMVRKAGKPDSVNDGDVQSNSGYTFRTYEAAPSISVKSEPREANFQQDADKIRAKKQKLNPNGAGRVLKPAGISPEYDTRGSGTVYPMSGLGQVSYREQKENKYTKKSFSKFRREAMDSPGEEMGVTGGYHGPSNKDPIDTLNKVDVTPSKKKNEKFQRIRR